jgi:hypothetical protein
MHTTPSNWEMCSFLTSAAIVDYPSVLLLVVRTHCVWVNRVKRPLLVSDMDVAPLTETMLSFQSISFAICSLLKPQITAHH